MRICKDCKWARHGKSNIVASADDEWYCTHPDEEKIETDYVTGEQTPIYPTCQDMRLRRGKVINYCGAEGFLYEGK